VCGRGGWEDGSDSDVMAAGRRGRAKTAGGMKAAEGGGGGEWSPNVREGGGTIEAESRSKQWGERNLGQTIE
jgi:hypothetical protein